jgi:hypothetical protein
MSIEEKDLKDMLHHAYPETEHHLSDVPFLEEIVEESPALFTLSTVLNFPQFYRNRQGRIVEIRGKITEGTKEFAAGFAYYSSEEEFFTTTGKLSDEESSNGDLIASLGDVGGDPSPYPMRTWIHYEHLLVSSFFKPLSPGKVSLQKGCHYVNRMGFVVRIDQSIDGIFVGEDNSSYDEDGRKLAETKTPFNLSSMYDLVYVIKNWSLFSHADWSTSKVLKHADRSSFTPEEFDPTQSADEKKNKIFFEKLIELHLMAKELRIPFGFHLNATDGIAG